MAIKQKVLCILSLTLFLSPSLYADPWASIVRFAGSVAGDVVKGYFKPALKFSEVDIIKKRMDILEYRFNKFDISKGKPRDYQEVGELINSLKNMTISLTTRVGNLEGKMKNLEQRIAVLEAKHRENREVVHHPESAPSQAYYTPLKKPENKAIKTTGNTRIIDCETTIDVNELMNCYSPIATDKDNEIEAAYLALSR